MKKKLLLTIFVLLSASACNDNKNSSSTHYDFSKVRFDLNYEIENDTYLDLTIFDGQTLSEPKEPNRRDYVFNGWYLDEACKNKFYGFNSEVEADITLYASWTPYDKLKDNVKINRFINKIKELSGTVGRATVKLEGITTYYSPAETSNFFYQEMEYNRYKDITTVDYYTQDKESKFAEQQYFYDDEKFYNVFKDIEGEGRDSYHQKANFNENRINRHLDIDFMNLYGLRLETLSSQIENGHSYNELDYVLELNDTHFDGYSEYYECKLSTLTYIESNEIGAFEEVYMMEYGFTFENGKIKRSRVVEDYLQGINGEVTMASQSIITTTYELVDQYPEFDGVRLNPLDYKDKDEIFG